MLFRRFLSVIGGIVFIVQVTLGLAFLFHSHKTYRTGLQKPFGGGVGGKVGQGRYVGGRVGNSSKGCSDDVIGLKRQYEHLERRYNDTLLEIQLLKSNSFSSNIATAAAASGLPVLQPAPAAIAKPPPAQTAKALPRPAQTVPPLPKAVQTAKKVGLILDARGAPTAGDGGGAPGVNWSEPFVFDPTFWGRIEAKRQTIEDTSVPMLNQSWAYLFASPFLDNPIHHETKKMMLATTEQAKKTVVQRRKYYITYGQNCCNNAKKLACDMALTHGFDECFAFDLNDVDKGFQHEHKRIFQSSNRGAGLWLWKPYLIYQMLGIMKEGDFLVYADAGSHLESPIHPLLGWMETYEELQGVLTFSLGLAQSTFCKRDAFVRQRCDTDACHSVGQVDGFMSAWRKGSHAVKVAGTWLHECQDFQTLSDEPNIAGLPNLPGFRAHRHDQALFTNIYTREGWARDTSHAAVLNMFKHDRNKGRL